MCDQCYKEMPPVRFHWTDLASTLVALCSGLVEQVMDAFDRTNRDIQRHHNWKVHRNQFANEAREAIEHIDDLKE